MNYLPFAGYFFYGATDATAMAAHFCSWGLLEDAPAPAITTYYRSKKSKFWSLYRLFYGRRGR